MKRVQNRKEKLCEDDVISDVEQDENFNNDDGKGENSRHKNLAVSYCDNDASAH